MEENYDVVLGNFQTTDELKFWTKEVKTYAFGGQPLVCTKTGISPSSS